MPRNERLQIVAARAWGVKHGDLSIHETMDDPRFQKLWNSFQREPTDSKRKRLGIPSYRKDGEKAEQRQLALQRMFWRYTLNRKESVNDRWQKHVLSLLLATTTTYSLI